MTLFDSANNVSVHDVAWSPNSSCIVAACGDHELKMWNTITGAFVSSLRGHTNVVTSCSFEITGEDIIVSSSLDGTVRVWDMRRQGECIEIHYNVQLADGGIYNVQLSPNGLWLCSSTDTGVVREMKRTFAEEI